MKYLIFLLCLFTACKTGTDSSLSVKEKNEHESAAAVHRYVLASEKGKQEAIASFVQSLSVEQRVSQMFLVNVGGNELYEPAEKSGSLYGKPDSGSPIVPGGYLFFSFNIARTPEQIRAFTDSIQLYCRMRDVIPPYISLDQEGGDVNRLRHITSRLPSALSVANAASVPFAYQLYYAQARQLHALGIHLNLAPVTEIQTAQNSHFLAGRSFGSAENVIRYGSAAVCAYENAGVGTVLKHFPGNTDTDPHTGLPEIVTDENTVDTLFVSPFASVMQREPAGVLMSHARVSCLDSGLPACLSHQWVTGVVRNQLHFKGLIFSDDIFMKALSDNGFYPEKAAVAAIEAGVNCLMFSGKTFGAVAGLIVQKAEGDQSFLQKITDSAQRVIAFKIAQGILTLRYDGDNHYTVVVPDPEKVDIQWKKEFYDARTYGNQLAESITSGYEKK